MTNPYSTLEFDLRPGAGLGVFEIGTRFLFYSFLVFISALGTSLWTILETLRRLQHQFPQVDIKFDPDSSTTTPIIVHLRPHISLLFSGTHQRLHTISLHSLQDTNPPIILKYKDAILSSSGDEVLRRVSVNRTFGPTYPSGSGSDDLKYPGIWFSFEEDPSSASGGGGGATTTKVGENRRLNLKGKEVEDRSNEVKKIMILQKCNDGKVQDALDEVMECSAMHGDIERAILKVSIPPSPFLFHSQPHKKGARWNSSLLFPTGNKQ
jgi:hypothetical protein